MAISLSLYSGDENMLAFRRMEGELLHEHYGEIAVFCEGKLVALGRDVKEAVSKARKYSKGKELFVKELYRPDEQTKAIL